MLFYFRYYCRKHYIKLTGHLKNQIQKEPIRNIYGIKEFKAAKLDHSHENKMTRAQRSSAGKPEARCSAFITDQW